MAKLKSYLHRAFGFLIAAGGLYYVSNILDHKSELSEILNQDKREAMAKETFDKVKEVHEHIITNNIESSINETLKNADLSPETKTQAQLAKDFIIDAKNSCLENIKYSISNTSVTKEVAKEMDAIKHYCFTKISNTAQELSKLQDFLNNEKNKFLSDFTGLNDYLNSLSLLETSALFHISGSLVILLTVFNILSVFFSNEIIKFFNLESKYPKLSKFFHLRRVFQKYNLLWNISIIFIICIATILINMLIFIL